MTSKTKWSSKTNTFMSTPVSSNPIRWTRKIAYCRSKPSKSVYVWVKNVYAS